MKGLSEKVSIRTIIKKAELKATYLIAYIAFDTCCSPNLNLVIHAVLSWVALNMDVFIISPKFFISGFSIPYMYWTMLPSGKAVCEILYLCSITYIFVHCVAITMPN